MRPAIGDRLQRLLAMLAHLAEVGWADYDELSQRFDLSPERIRHELTLASLCGVPPYDGASLIELVITDEGVSARIPDYLHRPPRLDRREGFAALAAGRVLLAVSHRPDDDGTTDSALGRALDKLGAALGMDPDDVHIHVDHPPLLDVVQAAAEAGETLEVRYYSAWRDETSDRRIDPLLVHHTAGRWYAEAYDHGHGEVRKFRVDRFEDARRTGDHARHHEVPDDLDRYVPGAAARTVRLRLPTDAGWVVESYPVEVEASHPDGTTDVRVEVVGRAWLERLLLRVGPGAEVLEPEADRDLGAAAARRLLAHYR